MKEKEIKREYIIHNDTEIKGFFDDLTGELM